MCGKLAWFLSKISRRIHELIFAATTGFSSLELDFLMQAAEAQRLGRKDDLFCTKTLGYASMNICKVEPKDFDEKHLLVMTYILLIRPSNLHFQSSAYKYNYIE